MSAQRSDMSRHFWGGFWGGLFGILACAWWHWAATAAGCLIGVVVGFWYQEIVEAWWTPSRISLLQIRRLRRRYGRSSPGSWLRQTLQLAILCGLYVFAALLQALIAAARTTPGLVVCFLNVHRSPLIAALRAHPMNRALATRVLLVTGFLAVNVWATLRLTALASSLDGDSIAFVTLFVTACAMIASVLALSCKHGITDLSQMRGYYQHYERWANRGVLYTVARDLVAMVAIEVLLLSSIVGGLAAIMIVACLFFLVMIPLALVIFPTLRALHFIATRSEHWQCFGVTLLVTSLSAYFAHAVLQGAVVFIVALITGCAAGATSVAVHHLLKLMFRRFPTLRFVAQLNFEEATDIPLDWTGRQLENALKAWSRLVVIMAV